MNPLQIEETNIEIYLDSAELKYYDHPLVNGYTTNATLMAKAGWTNYQEFVEQALPAAGGKPISFPVVTDDVDEMAKQARVISAWDDNVYVKIPIVNTQGATTESIIAELAADGIKLNITSIFTAYQLQLALGAYSDKTSMILSVFAGRIADLGGDPVEHMKRADWTVTLYSGWGEAQLLWASTRQVYDIIHADRAGCDIITVSPEILAKLDSIGASLEQRSLETVRQFHDDAQKAGYTL
ncbi:MAG: transaldolase [bacterium]|nr:transaldolase [bacterium]